MPDLTPDPAADARLRETARSSLAREAAAVDTEADLAALRERLAGVTSPVPAISGRPATTRLLAAAAAAVLIIAGITAIAWTRRGDDGQSVAPPAPSAATTVPSAAATPATTTAATTTTATTYASATTPETAPPPSDTASAESSTVAAAPDPDCTAEPLAPPALVDGSVPGEPAIGQSTEWAGRVATWGPAGSPIAVSQLLDAEHDASWVENGAPTGVHERQVFRTAANLAGDPATQPAHIVTFDVAAGCVRSYLVGPGYTYREADLLAQWWADALQLGTPWPTGGDDALGERGYFTSAMDRATYTTTTVREFAADGRLVRVVPDAELAAFRRPPRLPDGRTLSWDDRYGRCFGAPLVVNETGDPLHPDFASVSSVVLTDSGTVFATRDVCPTGHWGDEGSRSELLRFTPGVDSEPVILDARPPEPDTVWFDDGTVVYAGDHRPVVAASPDGRHLGLVEYYTTENTRWEIRRAESASEPIALASACDVPGDIVAEPVFVSNEVAAVARMCVDPTTAESPEGTRGSGTVRVEVVSLADNTLVWSNTTDWFTPNAYSSTTELVARSVDGRVTAIIYGPSDVEAPTRAVAIDADTAVEITRLGHDSYAFELADFIDPWQLSPG
jgi:hypothetical protein